MIYIMTTCRPDIAFVTGKLARGMHQPTRMHVNLLKGALKYLNCHRSTPLVYKRRNTEANKHFQRMQYEDGSCFCVGGSTYDPVSVMDMPDDSEIKDVIAGFTDADFAKSHAEQRRSTSGYAFFVYGNLVSWKSKLQPLTAGSTHEAELISLSFAADEGVWLRRLLTEIRFATIPGEPSYVYYESHDKHGKVVKSAKEHLKSLPATRQSPRVRRRGCRGPERIACEDIVHAPRHRQLGMCLGSARRRVARCRRRPHCERRRR